MPPYGTRAPLSCDTHKATPSEEWWYRGGTGVVQGWYRGDLQSAGGWLAKCHALPPQAVRSEVNIKHGVALAQRQGSVDALQVWAWYRAVTGEHGRTAGMNDRDSSHDSMQAKHDEAGSRVEEYM